MNHRITEYALKDAEISIIRAISSKSDHSISEIGAITGMSEGWVSQLIKDLEKKGYVTTSRRGMKKIAIISESSFAKSLSSLLTVDSNVPWEKLLSNSGIPVLLDSITKRKDFTKGVNRTTVWRAKRNFLMHGIAPKHSEIQSSINARLSRFINEYADYIDRRFIEGNIPKGAVILWRKQDECLFKINNRYEQKSKLGIRDILPTAFSAFARYGIPLLTSDSYYYFSPSKHEITRSDVVLHTLLIDPGSRTNITYALLFILKEFSKEELEFLIGSSKEYRLQSTIREIDKFLKTPTGPNSKMMPVLSDLVEQAELYGIDVR